MTTKRKIDSKTYFDLAPTRVQRLKKRYGDGKNGASQLIRTVVSDLYIDSEGCITKLLKNTAITA